MDIPGNYSFEPSDDFLLDLTEYLTDREIDQLIISSPFLKSRMERIQKEDRYWKYRLESMYDKRFLSKRPWKDIYSFIAGEYSNKDSKEWANVKEATLRFFIEEDLIEMDRNDLYDTLLWCVENDKHSLFVEILSNEKYKELLYKFTSREIAKLIVKSLFTGNILNVKKFYSSYLDVLKPYHIKTIEHFIFRGLSEEYPNKNLSKILEIILQDGRLNPASMYNNDLLFLMDNIGSVKLFVKDRRIDFGIFNDNVYLIHILKKNNGVMEYILKKGLSNPFLWNLYTLFDFGEIGKFSKTFIKNIEYVLEHYELNITDELIEWLKVKRNTFDRENRNVPYRDFLTEIIKLLIKYK